MLNMGFILSGTCEFYVLEDFPDSYASDVNVLPMCVWVLSLESGAE